MHRHSEPRPGRAPIIGTTIQPTYPVDKGVVVVTYDFAAWEGEPPVDDRAASAEHHRLHEKYIAPHFEPDLDTGEEVPPSDRMRAFVADLNARWPDLDDLDEEEVDDSPWADSPLIGNASGPYIYFATMYSKADTVAVFAAERAQLHGLVCLDVNENRLLT